MDPRRDLGIDAIVKAGTFLTALGHHDVELSQRTPHPMLGTDITDITD